MADAFGNTDSWFADTFQPDYINKWTKLKIDLQACASNVQEDPIILLDRQGSDSDVLLGLTEDTLERRIKTYTPVLVVPVKSNAKGPYGEPRKHSLLVQWRFWPRRTMCEYACLCRSPEAG